MQRTASAVGILGGAIFLIAWIVSPASSAPTVVARPPVVMFDEVALADINAQVDRLSDRLRPADTYQRPARDPFRFGQAPERPSPTLPSPPQPVSIPARLLPKLVAILGAPGEEASRRSAVLTEGDDVRIVTAGESVGGLTIDTVGDNGVTLVDPADGSTFRLPLR